MPLLTRLQTEVDAKLENKSLPKGGRLVRKVVREVVRDEFPTHPHRICAHVDLLGAPFSFWGFGGLCAARNFVCNFVLSFVPDFVRKIEALSRIQLRGTALQKVQVAN